jgi:hypothetical protein
MYRKTTKLISKYTSNRMSQRLGMADGRCFTIHTASTLFNDYVMTQNGIQYENNYAYRRLLQAKGPELVENVQGIQKSGPQAAPINTVNRCQSCDVPLLKVPDTY